MITKQQDDEHILCVTGQESISPEGTGRVGCFNFSGGQARAATRRGLLLVGQRFHFATSEPASCVTIRRGLLARDRRHVGCGVACVAVVRVCVGRRREGDGVIRGMAQRLEKGTLVHKKEAFRL